MILFSPGEAISSGAFFIWDTKFIKPLIKTKKVVYNIRTGVRILYM
jgi:hypothetical protein